MVFLFLLSLLLLINHHWKAPFIGEACLATSIKLEIARKYWRKFPSEKNPLCPELATSVLSREGGITAHSTITQPSYRTFFRFLKQRQP